MALLSVMGVAVSGANAWRRARASGLTFEVEPRSQTIDLPLKSE